MKLGCFAIGFGLFALTGCGSPGGVYQMSVEEAVDKIMSAEIVASNGAFDNPLGSLGAKASSPSAGKVTWVVDREVLCTATVTAVDEKSVQVETVCPGIDPRTGEATAESQISAGVKEFVTATLEDRAFDSGGVMASQMAGTAAQYPDSVATALSNQASQ